MDNYLPLGFNEIFETATNTLVTENRIKALIAAYDKALSDPRTVIPTGLHAAIEALRK